MKLEDAQSLPVTVEWDTWCGPTRATLVSVYAQGITIRSGDGYLNHWPTATLYGHDVAYLLAKLRKVDEAN